MILQMPLEDFYGIRTQFRVRVEDKDIRAVARFKRRPDASAEAAVCRGDDDPNVGKLPSDEPGAVVAGAVVKDDDISE